jgi:hypothetical protein
MKAMLAVLALCAPLAAQAVYKCKGEDGQVAYSDTPCPAAKESVKISGMPLKAQPERAASAPASPSALLSAAPPAAGVRSLTPARIHFGDNPEARLVSVVALLDNLALDGRDCEAALKAQTPKYTPCAAFATHIGPGREWTQALAEVDALLKEPGLFERRRGEFAKVSGLIDRISSHLQFMERRLSSRN